MALYHIHILCQHQHDFILGWRLWGQRQKRWVGREYCFIQCCIDKIAAKHPPNCFFRTRPTPYSVKSFFIGWQYWRILFQTTVVCKPLFNGKEWWGWLQKVHSATSQVCACRSSWLRAPRSKVEGRNTNSRPDLVIWALSATSMKTVT